MRERSTTRSRTTGNFVIGSRTMASPRGEMRSIIALQDWRTRPSTSIVHEPQTSSRHTHSQTIGATFSPADVTGRRWTSMSAPMTFMCGRHGTRNSCQ